MSNVKTNRSALLFFCVLRLKLTSSYFSDQDLPGYWREINFCDTLFFLMRPEKTSNSASENMRDSFCTIQQSDLSSESDLFWMGWNSVCWLSIVNFTASEAYFLDSCNFSYNACWYWNLFTIGTTSSFEEHSALVPTKSHQNS